MRKLIKIAHTLGAVGLLGTMVTLLVVLGVLPEPAEDLNSYALLTDLVDRLARWLLLPSLTAALVSGLLAISQGPSYHSAGGLKEAGYRGDHVRRRLLTVQGPLQRGSGTDAAISGRRR